MNRFLFSAVAVAVTAVGFHVGPIQGSVLEQIGRSDQRGVLLAHVGEMRFYAGNTGLSTCTHGLVLDEAALLHHRHLPGTPIVLKGRSHRAGRDSMLDARTYAAYRYLTDEKGTDPGLILIQTDRDIVKAVEPDLAVSIDVYVAIRGLLPNRDYVIRSFVPVLIDGDQGAARDETRRTSACSGARAARSFLCP